MSSRFKLLGGMILLIALLLRVGALIAVQPWSDHYERLYLFADARVYHELAVTLQKDGITDDFRNKVAVFAPGYPILLGMLYKTFGANLTLALIANVIISVFTCGVIMAATRKAFDERAALTAGLLFAFHPHSIRFSCILYTETLFMLITAIFMLVLMQTSKSSNGWLLWLVLAGLIASLGTFVRVSMLYFSVLSVLIWLVSNKLEWFSISKRFCLFVVSYAAFLTPWMIYNKIHYNTYRLSTSGEYNLLHIVVAGAKTDNIDEFHRVRKELVEIAHNRAAQAGARNPFEISRYYLDVAIEEILKDPVRIIWSQLKGVFHFWFRVSQAKSDRIADLRENDPKTVYYIYYSHLFQIFLFLTWILLFIERGRIPISWKALSVAAVIYFAFTVGNAAYSRFFLQALPFIVPVAAVNIVGFLDWICRLVKTKINRQSD
jgi:4-amino-4-deoxy-L-arabinose transferase-like glycosyltransferase